MHWKSQKRADVHSKYLKKTSSCQIWWKSLYNQNTSSLCPITAQPNHQRTEKKKFWFSYVFHTHTHTYIIHTHTYYVTAVNRYQFPKADPEGNEKHSYSAHQKEVKGTPKHTDHRKAHDKQEWIMEQESDFDPCVLWGHSFPVSWGHPCFWGPVQLEAGTPL